MPGELIIVRCDCIRLTPHDPRSRSHNEQLARLADINKALVVRRRRPRCLLMPSDARNQVIILPQCYVSQAVIREKDRQLELKDEELARIQQQLDGRKYRILGR